MVRQISPENFGSFGTILAENERRDAQYNHHSLALTENAVSVYRAVAPTWLSRESGLTVLSVSEDGQRYEDFYLDKPVCLDRGVRFSLTAIGGNASVQMAGFSLPLLEQTRAGGRDFTVTPQRHADCLYTLFCQEMEQGFLTPGQEHPAAELLYVDRGSIHSVAQGQDLLLSQGEMVLYEPGQWRMQYAPVGIAPRLVRVTFAVSGWELGGLSNRRFPFSRRAVSILQQMLREQERPETCAEDMLLSLLNLLLITLARESDSCAQRQQAGHSLNNENEIVARAQRYIGDHVCQKLSVPSVAAGIQVSASYLTALFHKHLQISPGEYIRRIKLQESKRLIREGNQNLTQIAQLLQYSTIHHFSRQFKDKFGITPSEYARSVR